jgi:hypothetical protein
LGAGIGKLYQELENMKSFRDYFLKKYPFGIVEQQHNRQKILSEGLITSYPIDKLLSMLVRTYGKNIYDISKNFYNEETKTAGVTFFTKEEFGNSEFIKDLESKIDVYGYFIATQEEIPESKEIGFFLEPKYPFKIGEKDIRDMKCFHITHKDNLQRIEKVGLIPKDTQTEFKYGGDRIYLMFSNSSFVVRKLGAKIAEAKELDPKDLRVLEITNFSNLTLYFDMNCDPIPNNIACFTFQNIHPDNIKFPLNET